MRLAIWLFILWQAFWLNAFVPGHTRGAITMPGGEPSAGSQIEESHSCCAVPMGASKNGKEPTEQQRQRCAVCYIVKGYTVATVYYFELDLSGRVFERVETFAAQITIIDFVFPFYPIGPPLA